MSVVYTSVSIRATQQDGARVAREGTDGEGADTQARSGAPCMYLAVIDVADVVLVLHDGALAAVAAMLLAERILHQRELEGECHSKSWGQVWGLQNPGCSRPDTEI